jgi:hypothetical protein
MLVENWRGHRSKEALYSANYGSLASIEISHSLVWKVRHRRFCSCNVARWRSRARGPVSQHPSACELRTPHH